MQANEPVQELAAQWREVLPLVRLVFFESGHVAGAPHWLEIYKTAANLVGHDVGAPRPPFELLNGEDEARLRGIISRIGVLSDAVAD